MRDTNGNERRQGKWETDGIERVRCMKTVCGCTISLRWDMVRDGHGPCPMFEGSLRPSIVVWFCKTKIKFTEPLEL